MFDLRGSQNIYLLDIFGDLYQKYLHHILLARTTMLLFLGIWVLSGTRNLQDFLYYSSLLSLMLGLGLAYFLFRDATNRFRWNPLYALIALDALLLAVILLYRPYATEPLLVHLNGQAFLYYFALLGWSVLSYSPVITAWATLCSVFFWNLGVALFLSAPYVVTLVPVGAEHDMMMASNSGYWNVGLQQSILMLAIGGMLSFALWQLREQLGRQIISEREFHEILLQENKQIQHEQEHQSETPRSLGDYIDTVTGLGTRLAFQRDSEQFTKVFAEGRLIDLTIAFINLEGAEKLLQERGQESYDEMIRAFAIAARKQFRSSDMAYRLKTDQFALLAPGATRANSVRLQTLLENIMKYVSAQGFPEIQGKMGLSTLEEAEQKAADAP
ncbi:GGDEF domain-containing protein [Candidatus Venteria ishoeyi]|uniref:GGDEF domain-containing protein n=1 Tax=Candidatus Venteria ishoeyi TaxID=1899563 RepID=UPI0025A606B2|nr:GGDEF domain-containing protein [Candidatus Venteria ishoeyi]MDM8547335.1 GGDEF domain-containing protein [Candidatus Venteria ishoeyi]